MKTNSPASSPSELVIVPPPPVTPANRWVQNETGGLAAPGHPRQFRLKPTRDDIRAETARNIASRQSPRAGERSRQPRSRKAGTKRS